LKGKGIAVFRVPILMYDNQRQELEARSHAA
jgi:hypothetical protein